MGSADGSSWQAAITASWDAFIAQIVAAAPQLLAAIAVLLLGWFVAQLLRLTTRRLMRGLDSLWSARSAEDNASQLRTKRTQAIIVSNLVFWIVLIFFVAISANLTGWQMLTNWMDSVIAYLPNLVSGLLIMLTGFLLSNVVGKGVIGAADSAGMSQGTVLARIAQIVVIFTTSLIGIEQIGINVDFLTHVLIVIVGVLLAGAALAFGLGARSLIANLIGSQYLRKHCRIGEHMQIGGIEGDIVEVTQTCIVLETENGRAVIPGRLFQEQISSFKSATAEQDEIPDASARRED